MYVLYVYMYELNLCVYVYMYQVTIMYVYNIYVCIHVFISVWLYHIHRMCKRIYFFVFIYLYVSMYISMYISKVCFFSLYCMVLVLIVWKNCVGLCKRKKT